MNKPGQYTLERHQAQAVAEFAVAVAFGLPLPKKIDEGELSSYGIHVMLRVGDGIPQQYHPSDLVVVCGLVAPDAKELESLPPQLSGETLAGYKVEIKGIAQADESGVLHNFVDNPAATDLKKVIADYLEKRRMEMN
jgi:hypothetical protein